MLLDLNNDDNNNNNNNNNNKNNNSYISKFIVLAPFVTATLVYYMLLSWAVDAQH